MFDTTSTTITQRWSSICMMYVGSWWKMNDWQHWTMFRLKKIIHTHLCVQCTCIYVYIVQCFDYQRHYILLDILQQCSRGCSQVHSHYSTFFLLYFDNAESSRFQVDWFVMVDTRYVWETYYYYYYYCTLNLLNLFAWFVYSFFLFPSILHFCSWMYVCLFVYVYIYMFIYMYAYLCVVTTCTQSHTNIQIT